MPARPLIGLTLGDPAGIGPELCLAALEEPALREEMRLVLLGPAELRPPGVTHITAEELEAPGDRREPGSHAWLASETRGSWDVGRPQASAGHAALAALRAGSSLAQAGHLDALVTAPVSKQALHLAGERVEGQTELLGRWAGCGRVEMLGVAGRMRVMLLTRHMPLKNALESITTDAVVDALSFLARGLHAFGFATPRLALAGMNPHAGEAGLLGSEERELLEPAVQRARAAGLDVVGPESPDTVFLRAARGAFDAVLALYHDQGFIPLKLAEPDRALTVLLGLPYLRVSPAHGTAFDIAGQGRARTANLFAALRQAASWAAARGAPT